MQRCFEGWQRWQGQQFDALFQEFLRHCGAGTTADIALLQVPVVHGANLIGQAIAHVFGGVHQFAQGLHQAALAFANRLSKVRPTRRLMIPRKVCRPARVTEVQTRCSGHFVNRRVATQRTAQLPALALQKEIFFAGKPAFKVVLPRAAQVQDFHARGSLTGHGVWHAARPVQRPGTGQQVLQPQSTCQGFAVDDAAVATGFQHLLG